jgi:glucokinase
MSERTIIGLDIGGTKTAVVVATPGGKILSRAQFATRTERGFQPVFDELTSAVADAIAGVGRTVPVVISVSIGGPLRILEGIIDSPPNLPGWDAIPLKRLLSERFGCPVYVEHDGNAGALAEMYFGAGQGYRNIVFLTMGTGLGAGLILDGRLYRGSADVAGEIGHVRIAEDGPPAYGKAGSMEGFASGPSLSALARTMFPGLWPEGVSPAELAALARAGKDEARAVLARSSLYLGRCFALLADVLNPEVIIVGGIGMRMFDVLVEPALEHFRQEALPQTFASCRVVPARLGEAIGDLASLCAALDQGNLATRPGERRPE